MGDFHGGFSWDFYGDLMGFRGILYGKISGDLIDFSGRYWGFMVDLMGFLRSDSGDLMGCNGDSWLI